MRRAVAPRFLAVLWSLLLVLQGCGDGSGPAPDGASPPAGGPPAATSGAAAVAGADGPRVPSWFRAGPPADGSREARPVAFEIIHSQAVVPTQTASTIATPDDSIRVHVPPGAVSEPGRLTIGKPKELPALPDEGMKVLVACDVSLEGQTVLQAPLELELAIDPEALPEASGKDSLAALSWHPGMQAWVSVPAKRSQDGKRVSLRTRHLTLFLLVLRPLNLLRLDSAFTSHFSIYYDADAIAGDSEAADTPFGKRLADEAAAGGEPLGIATMTGPGEVGVEGIEGQPQFIVYLGSALEYAHGVYKTSGLAVPEWTRSEIYVDVNWPWGGTSQRGKLLGAIWISPVSDSMPRQLRVSTAHEYFHAIQAGYLGAAVMSMNYRTWWLEALAEYASHHVWKDKVDIKPLTRDFLFKPLVTTDDPHTYATAHFVQYLVENCRIGFGPLTIGTLDVPASILSMEEGSALDFVLLKIALGIEGPFASYSAAVTLGALDAFCARSGRDLLDLYHGFAVRLLFDANVTKLCKDGDDLLKVAGLAALTETLPVQQTEISRSLTLRAGGVCDLLAVSVEPKDDPQAPPRSVEVIVPKERPARTRIDVFLLKDNLRVAGGVKPVATFAEGSKDRVTLHVGKGDMLYVLGTSIRGEDVSLRVTIRKTIDLKIIPARVEAARDDEQTLLVWGSDFPDDTGPRLELRWDFGDDATTKKVVDRPGPSQALTEDFKHGWNKEGKFPVRVEVRDASKTDGPPLASATAEVEVGPPGPSITLEARVIVAPLRKPFEVTATPENAPPGVRFHWQFADGPIQATDKPSVTLEKDTVGSYPLKVTMFDPDEGVHCVDECRIEIEAQEDVIWIREHADTPTGKQLRLEYQIKAKTKQKHGIWRGYYTEGDGAGTFKSWHPNGQQSALGQFDASGRKTGRWESWFPNGCLSAMHTYLEGTEHGPFRENFKDTTDPWRIGTSENGRTRGDLTFYKQVGIKDGKPVYEKTVTPYGADGKIDGVQRRYSSGGVLEMEATYSNGVRNGPGRTYMVPEGWLWSEVIYEDGKPVKTRIFNEDGTVKSERVH